MPGPGSVDAVTVQTQSSPRSRCHSREEGQTLGSCFFAIVSTLYGRWRMIPTGAAGVSRRVVRYLILEFRKRRRKPGRQEETISDIHGMIKMPSTSPLHRDRSLKAGRRAGLYVRAAFLSFSWRPGGCEPFLRGTRFFSRWGTPPPSVAYGSPINGGYGGSAVGGAVLGTR